MIRTGGEHRLSNFLIWQSAYAELVTTDTLWPDFGPADLDVALARVRQPDAALRSLTGMLRDRARSAAILVPPLLVALWLGGVWVMLVVGVAVVLAGVEAFRLLTAAGHPSMPHARRRPRRRRRARRRGEVAARRLRPAARRPRRSSWSARAR